MSSEPFWIPDGLNQVLSPELDEKITKPTNVIITIGVEALDDELSQVTMLFDGAAGVVRDKLLSVYKKRLEVIRKAINRKIVEEILEELGNHSIRVRNKTYQILI